MVFDWFQIAKTKTLLILRPIIDDITLLNFFGE